MKKYIFFLIIGFLIFSCSTTKPLSNKFGKTSPMEKFGSIDNRNVLDSLLSSITRKEIDHAKPLVVIYYPGKDKCNSSGASTRETTRIWYNEMEKGVNKITKSNILYIYKDSIGLYGRHDGYKYWNKDPEKIFERLFFNDLILCSGFVLVLKNGNYYSLSSEFGKEFLWKRLKQLIK